MEGFFIVDSLMNYRMKVVMLRVVSNGVNQNLPDLQDAINAERRLNIL